MILFEKIKEDTVSPFLKKYKMTRIPAKENLNPAENNGGTPDRIPNFIAKNVVPKMIHTRI